MNDQTVYVNDHPINETEVYHARRGHVTQRRRWTGEHIRETTPTDAQAEGLRPCKQCFPDGTGRFCPACGHKGDGDDVLAGGQRWCPNRDCRIVSFREEADDA